MEFLRFWYVFRPLKRHKTALKQENHLKSREKSFKFSTLLFLLKTESRSLKPKDFETPPLPQGGYGLRSYTLGPDSFGFKSPMLTVTDVINLVS